MNANNFDNEKSQLESIIRGFEGVSKIDNFKTLNNFLLNCSEEFFSKIIESYSLNYRTPESETSVSWERNCGQGDEENLFDSYLQSNYSNPEIKKRISNKASELLDLYLKKTSYNIEAIHNFYSIGGFCSDKNFIIKFLSSFHPKDLVFKDPYGIRNVHPEMLGILVKYCERKNHNEIEKKELIDFFKTRAEFGWNLTGVLHGLVVLDPLNAKEYLNLMYSKILPNEFSFSKNKESFDRWAELEFWSKPDLFKLVYNKEPEHLKLKGDLK